MPHRDCRLAIALVDDELAALDEQVGEGAGAPESHAAADGADYRSARAVDRHAAADVDSHGMSGRPLRRRADHSSPQRRHVYHAMTHVLSAAGSTSRPQKGHEVTAVAGKVLDMRTQKATAVPPQPSLRAPRQPQAQRWTAEFHPSAREKSAVRPDGGAGDCGPAPRPASASESDGHEVASDL